MNRINPLNILVGSVLGLFVLILLMLTFASTAHAGIFDSADAKTSVETTVEVDNRNSADADARSSSDADADARSYSDSDSTALSGSVSNTGPVTVTQESISEGAAREFSKHAETSAEAYSSSDGANPACGDSTGLSAQTGFAGASLATVPEACRAFRAAASESQLRKNGFGARATAVKIGYWIGFPFRTILHVATFGVLN